jgi:LuxR family maltose regulon positive regulatory protein
MYLCGIALKVLEKPGAPAFFNDPKSLITIIHFNQGLVYEFSGDLMHAAHALDQAFNNALETRNFHIITLSLSHMAQNQMIEGKLHLAMETFLRSVDLSKGVENTISPLSGLAKVGLGNLFYEWNDLVNARQLLEEGVALAKQWNNWETLVPGYRGLARLLWAEGNYQGAYAKLDELKSFLKENKVGNFSTVLELFYSHFWIMEGKLAKVEHWLADSSIHADQEINHIQEPFLAILARYLAMKHDAKVENLVTKLVEYTSSQGQGGRLLEIYITKALWCDLTQNKVVALETLREALRLAEPEGNVRIFVDEGSSMARLIYQAAQEGFMPHYTAKLLAAFPPTDLEPMEKQRLTSLQSPFVEPLSEREIEVLHLISEGLSNAEIASRLTLSITTVKSHTRNINLKLGVNSRTQAVARARTLGILA